MTLMSWLFVRVGGARRPYQITPVLFLILVRRFFIVEDVFSAAAAAAAAVRINSSGMVVAYRTPLAESGITLDLNLSTLLEPQPRFGDKPLNFQVVCPRNGTAALKGLSPLWATAPPSWGLSTWESQADLCLCTALVQH